MNARCVFLFDATSHALRAEKLAKRNGIAVRLIPVPRHLSSDCGVCLRVGLQDSEAIRGVLSAGGVRSTGPHELDPR